MLLALEWDRETKSRSSHNVEGSRKLFLATVTAFLQFGRSCVLILTPRVTTMAHCGAAAIAITSTAYRQGAASEMLELSVAVGTTHRKASAAL